MISQIASGTPTYAHSDGLGSIRLLTDGSGTVVGTQEYDAFGATRSQTGVQLPFTYTGEQVDPESGLVYLRNRYLDPATGRFLTPDPLGINATGTNQYVYTSDNPLSTTDPLGLYDYHYEWYIGESSVIGSPEQVMAYFQQHASEIFPFSLGQCTVITPDEKCYLDPATSPAPGLPLIASPVCDLYQLYLRGAERPF